MSGGEKMICSQAEGGSSKGGGVKKGGRKK
jgi:hypothetical protein